MIIDANLTFSEDQAVTATAISTNVIKLPDAGTVYGEAAAITRNLGPGNEIPLLIQVTEAFNTLTSLTITLETSAAAGLTSSTVLASSGAIALASLAAGYRPSFTRIMPDGNLLDYVGLRFTVTGTNPTTGKISAALATEVNT
jgi:Bbp16-like protein